MRKLTLLMLMLVTVVAYSSEPGPWIGIKITFGKPKRDCKGFGVCSVQIIFNFDEIKDDLFASNDENVGYAYPVDSKNGKFEFSIQKSSMTKSTYEKHFSTGVFIVEEDLKLPKSVVDELNLNPGYTIKKGNYNFVESKDKILLTL